MSHCYWLAVATQDSGCWAIATKLFGSELARGTFLSRFKSVVETVGSILQYVKACSYSTCTDVAAKVWRHLAQRRIRASNRNVGKVSSCEQLQRESSFHESVASHMIFNMWHMMLELLHACAMLRAGMRRSKQRVNHCKRSCIRTPMSLTHAHLSTKHKFVQLSNRYNISGGLWISCPLRVGLWGVEGDCIHSLPAARKEKTYSYVLQVVAVLIWQTYCDNDNSVIVRGTQCIARGLHCTYNTQSITIIIYSA